MRHGWAQSRPVSTTPVEGTLRARCFHEDLLRMASIDTATCVARVMTLREGWPEKGDVLKELEAPCVVMRRVKANTCVFNNFQERSESYEGERRAMATQYATVTWDQLHRDARALASALMVRAPFKGVVAVTRGGLIPAAIIARELDCRLVETISIVSYAGERAEDQGEPQMIKPPIAAGDGENFLIIDDLVDSGETAKLVREVLPKAYFACLYAKPNGKPLTDQFVIEVPQETWVLFPWDTAPLFVPPLARKMT